MMAKFKKYKRIGFSEMREVLDIEILDGAEKMKASGIMVSNIDIKNGSPKEGDMIARNLEDRNDQWLVAKKYFEDNFTEV
jgi:hypothetical protein